MYDRGFVTILSLKSETTLFLSVDHDGRKKVFKIFYCLDRRTSSLSLYGAALYQSLLNGCVVMSRGAHPTAIYVTYDYVEGAHDLLNSSQAIKIIVQLLQLHDSFFVHGDIRQYNIIFGPTYSTLIDFDLSGKATIDRYPRGYNHQILDGARHPEACGGETMLKEHDWYGLAAVFDLFKPCIVDLQPFWTSITQDIKSGYLKSALDELEKQPFFDLKQKLSGEKSIKCGTGTPPQPSPDDKHAARPPSADNSATPRLKQARLN